MFDESKCTLCGDCLVECQYVDYDREEAIRQRQELRAGRPAPILKECVTCAACNEVCPQGANPFDHINALQEKFGSLEVPDFMRKFFDAGPKMPSSVTPGDPDRPALSLCVMGPMVPDSFKGPMFDGMTTIRGGDYFCQIGYIHIGMESPMRDGARAFVDNLAAVGAREIVFIHDDCYAALEVKAPEYGVKVPFRAIHIFEYLRDYLRDHRSRISKLDMDVAYQRPCSSRYTPEKDAMLDEIFELIGVRPVQRKYERIDALCCGGTMLAIHPDKAVETQERNLADALDAGAKAMVYLCPLCVRAMGEAASRRGFENHMISDLCRLALGETPAAS
jgi:Fe-S oxidoreductase